MTRFRVRPWRPTTVNLRYIDVGYWRFFYSINSHNANSSVIYDYLIYMMYEFYDVDSLLFGNFYRIWNAK